MIFQRSGVAVIALGAALSMGYAPPLHAQAQTTTTTERSTTTETQMGDAANWQAPRGYDQAYPENGTPNMVARQGYAAGFNEGTADASRGLKFEPTDNKAYGKAVIPKGMNKDEFRQQFREAFVKGYTNGYKKE